MKNRKKYFANQKNFDHLHTVKVLNILENFKENMIELEKPEIYIEPS
jgi:hypothetical protein